MKLDRTAVVISFVSLFALAASSAFPVEAKLLQGALQQSETLPPLSDRFQVSRPFSEELLGYADNMDEWVKIPRALAGTWSRNGTILLKVHDEASQKDTYPNLQSFPHGSFTRGFQVDAQGNIWDCPRARRHRFETSDDGKSIQYIIITGGRQMLVTGPDSLRDFGEVTLVDVDTRTRLITRVQRSVQIVLRKVVAPGKIQVDSTTSTYTLEGRLVNTSIDRSFEQLTAEFTPLDSLNGLDLKVAFERFEKMNSDR